MVEISLQKKAEGWWKSVVEGDAEIDLDLIEGSKYLDDSLLRKIKVGGLPLSLLANKKTSMHHPHNPAIK
mgnify:CR=1 FL=1